MSLNFPELLHPQRFAEQGRHICGQIPLSRLQALSDLLMDSVGFVTVDLRFGYDPDHRVCYISGVLETQLSLQCQRCLQAMLHPLRIEVNLSPISSDSASTQFPSVYEPIVVQDDEITLIQLVEEELLLALPLVPKHVQDC